MFSAAVQYTDIRITGYSRLDAASPLDAVGSASGSNATIQSGNITTSKSDELLFGAGTTTGTFTAAGSGYTLHIVTNPDADIARNSDISSVGTYSATVAQNGEYVMRVVAFKAFGQ